MLLSSWYKRGREGTDKENWQNLQGQTIPNIRDTKEWIQKVHKTYDKRNKRQAKRKPLTLVGTAIATLTGTPTLYCEYMIYRFVYR